MKLIIDMYSMYTLNPLYTISEILHVSHRLVPFNRTEFNTTLGIVMPNPDPVICCLWCIGLSCHCLLKKFAPWVLGSSFGSPLV